jgi:hypothetical protein
VQPEFFQAARAWLVANQAGESCSIAASFARWLFDGGLERSLNGVDLLTLCLRVQPGVPGCKDDLRKLWILCDWAFDRCKRISLNAKGSRKRVKN